ncbi:RES domain-containing protein [Paenibacillus sp. 481]|uniref:RES domain-containing protein n=1 Tax=Paenibacillus sp. 481 TaxID=2835869 RepID=UPI001E63D3FD|nr:RES domain-containing protein [Paenibacillus sp. 481]UHA73448.1 RES domain-containing protein [Paenibacillus sp. 481]
MNCFELSSTFVKLDINPLESIISYVDELQSYVETYNEHLIDLDLKCSICCEDLQYDDYFVVEEKEEQLVKAISEMLGNEISTYIHYCSRCDIVNELFEANKMSVIEIGEKKYDEGLSITKFLEEHFIPSQYVKHIIPYLSCGCCGFGYHKESKTYHKGNFIQSFRVLSNDHISAFLDIDLSDWINYAEKYHIYLRDFEVQSFLSFLKKNPLLAYKHPVGARFYELFDAMLKEGDYFTLDIGTQLFRGRTRPIGSKKFERTEIWEPPFGVSSHGRYNIVGTSVLYLSNHKEYIPYEVNYNNDQELDVALFEVKKPLKILDLSNLLGDFGRFLSQSSKDRNILKFEYLLTNYISACCLDVGFNGVKYKGVKEGNYENYALLNYQHGIDLEIISLDTAKIQIQYKFNN